MKNLTLSTLLICFYLIACFSKPNSNGEQTTKALEIDQKALKEVKIIGHKGSGDPPSFGYKNFRSNSFESIKNAINRIEGSEIDIQISADSTLWVIHDPILIDCQENEHNIANLKDHEIEEINQCKFKNQLIKLKELKDKLNNLNVENKVLSLDLKVLQNEAAISLFGGSKTLSSAISKKIIPLKELNGFDILVEVPNQEVISIFENSTPFDVFELLVYGKRKNKLNNQNYSFDLYALVDNNQLVESKVNKSQIWTVNSANEMLQALTFNPDFIQTDNVAMGETFIELKSKKLKINTLFHSHSFPFVKSMEYQMISNLKLTKEEKGYFLNFSFEKIIPQKTECLLVFSAKNKNGETIYWKGYELNDRVNVTEYIDAAKLASKSCDLLKVYIWNKVGESIELIEPQLSKHSL